MLSIGAAKEGRSERAHLLLHRRPHLRQSGAAGARTARRALPTPRGARGGRQLVMGLDIALHLGDVFYGNVGSVDRLDFTIIGPAVNEASRIEALCAQHDRNLLISETFAQAATNSADRLISIGRYGLRGVRSAQSIYTLDGH
jgi:adenylate cyclase